MPTLPAPYVKTIMDTSGSNERQSGVKHFMPGDEQERNKSMKTAFRKPSPGTSFPTAREGLQFNRRSFLKTALQAGAVLAMPQIVRGAVLGKDGGVAPSERIVLGAIGTGNRGTYDLGCFLEEKDVQFV